MKSFDVHLGDCIPHMMTTMKESSVDCSVFSPPFPALYAYTSDTADIGNSEELDHEARIHLGYFYRGLCRVLKPGRVAVVHVMQIPRLKRSGGEGLFDFRGLNIRIAQRAGFIFEYDWLVTKNPQAQAIRTKSHNLQFAGLEKDRANCRGALGDYLIKIRKPGENAVPIRDMETPLDDDGDRTGDPQRVHQTQVSRNDWIGMAEAAWTDIRETDTLNTIKAEGDTRHICPLQLSVIRRLVKLYSNPGELVFSPFTGIGSEGHVAMELGRRFYGCELKPEYHRQAVENIGRAARKASAATEANLFAEV